MKKALLLLMFSPLCFAAAPACVSQPNWIAACLTESVGDVIPVIALLSVLAIGLAYSLGTALSRPEWVLFAKDEFYHLAISLVLLASFVGVIEFTDVLTNSVFEQAKESLALTDPCAAYVNTQEISTCYMGKMADDAEEIISYYSKRQIDLLLEASQYVSYYGLDAGTTFSPYAYKRTWSMTVDSMNNLFVLPAYMSIMAQHLFVGFFMGAPCTGSPTSCGPSSSSIFTLILPAAFFLRFVPLLRDTGNLLIAISLGLYTLVPFMIALNGMMYSLVFSDCLAYESVIDDAVLGGCAATGNLFEVAALYPQAFLLPNVIISVFVTFAASAAKALRMIT